MSRDGRRASARSSSPEIPSVRAPQGESLAELSALLVTLGADVPEPERTVTAALELADAAVRAGSEERAGAELLAGVTFAAYALAAPLPESAVGDVVEALARTGTCSEASARVELFVRALNEVAQADVAPRVALDAQLRLLAALAPAASVSLWIADGADAGPVASAGESPPARLRRGNVAVVPLGGGDRVLAAVPRAKADSATCIAYLELAAPAVAVLVERELREEHATAGEASVAATSERRLTRLGFDLHDGALQNVVALATDLRLFRSQLATVLGDEHTAIVLGRIDDLEARLLELERELRELAQSLQPQSLLARPLPEAVRAEVEAFGARSAIATTLTLDGGFDDLTVSQRLAVLRVLQEALTNAREHGRATQIEVLLAQSPDGLRLEVVDNGRGFPVELALERAARRGSLGLAGMRERVALLGGSFSIESRGGGPTTVSARLPRWTPMPSEQR